MKALDLNRDEQGDIAEKLRVEETKAQLAAAREGMEKEAQRLKEKKEQEKQDAATTKPRFGAAAAGMSGTGKWLPPHMRTGAAAPSRMGWGAGGPSQKVDTEDQNLFPDLAAADKILEKQKAQPAYKVPKKTPVGGGATWANEKKVKQETTPKVKEEIAAPPPSAAEPEPAPTPVEPVAAVKQPIKPKKKKKKDISTFKKSS